MKVGWEGKTLHFVSMYVPVQPAKRKVFLSKLFMGKRAIVMGDFNCVENVQLDVRHAAAGSLVAIQYTGTPRVRFLVCGKVLPPRSC